MRCIVINHFHSFSSFGTPPCLSKLGCSYKAFIWSYSSLSCNITFACSGSSEVVDIWPSCMVVIIVINSLTCSLLRLPFEFNDSSHDGLKCLCSLICNSYDCEMRGPSWAWDFDMKEEFSSVWLVGLTPWNGLFSASLSWITSSILWATIGEACRLRLLATILRSYRFCSSVAWMSC